VRTRDLAKIAPSALSPLHTLLWGVHARQGVTITALNCGLKEFAKFALKFWSGDAN
jgi:hypothetical protein